MRLQLRSCTAAACVATSTTPAVASAVALAVGVDVVQRNANGTAALGHVWAAAGLWYAVAVAPVADAIPALLGAATTQLQMFWSHHDNCTNCTCWLRNPAAM
jgi:hypothetical protein